MRPPGSPPASPDDAAPARPGWLRLAGGAALAASLYALVLGLWQAEALAAAWRNLRAETVLAVAGLCWLNYLLRGWRWWTWLAQNGCRLRLRRAMRLYLCGYAFTATPGNVGEALRGTWVRPGEPMRALGIFGAERLADLSALLLLSLSAAPVLWPALRGRLTDWGSHHSDQLLPRMIEVLAGAGEGVLPAVLIGLSTLLLAAGLALLLRLRRWWPTWLAEAGHCLRARPWRWLLVTLLAWAAQGLAVWLLARDLMLPLDLGLATGYYAAAMVGGAVSALPAGLGSMEALLTAMLVASGAALAPALVLVLLVRVFTLWQAIVAGALVLAWSLIVLKDPRLG